MARPRKENAEYFSHDSGMRNDEKVLALRSKFGNQGYAFWCMFLEILTHEEGFKKEIKTEVQKELLAGDLRVSVEEMQDILSFCSRIELLQEKDSVFWSDNLIKRLEPMVQKREFLRQKYENKRVSAPEMPVSTAEMPQSKVKESKVYILGDKSPVNNKSMYEEPIIQLDESGEEIEVQKPHTGTFGKFTHLVAKHYCELLGKNITGQHTAHTKELLTFLKGRYPKMTNEQLTEEAIGAINHFDSEYKKKNITDWGLRKIIENYDK